VPHGTVVGTRCPVAVAATRALPRLRLVGRVNIRALDFLHEQIRDASYVVAARENGPRPLRPARRLLRGIAPGATYCLRQVIEHAFRGRKVNASIRDALAVRHLGAVSVQRLSPCHDVAFDHHSGDMT